MFYRRNSPGEGNTVKYKQNDKKVIIGLSTAAGLADKGFYQ
jgi:hypothetical protein